MLGFFVIGKIILHDTTHMKIIGKLKCQYRIINLTGTHLIQIFLRTHRIRILIIIRNTTTEHDRFQIQFLA